MKLWVNKEWRYKKKHKPQINIDSKDTKNILLKYI